MDKRARESVVAHAKETMLCAITNRNYANLTVEECVAVLEEIKFLRGRNDALRQTRMRDIAEERDIMRENIIRELFS